ncbi:MAG: hypothetical protein ABIB71_00795 [Candidatus Woesearchaeota archaeon]
MKKVDLEQKMKQWIPEISKPGKQEGVSLSFICAHEELKQTVAKYFGRGKQGHINYFNTSSHTLLPSEIEKAVEKAQEAYETSFNSEEEKFNGQLHKGSLAYKIEGKLVLSSSIYEICKDKGKGSLKEEIKGYNIDEALTKLWEEIDKNPKPSIYHLWIGKNDNCFGR